LFKDADTEGRVDRRSVPRGSRLRLGYRAHGFDAHSKLPIISLSGDRFG
jgi:hypothetical protein